MEAFMGSWNNFFFQKSITESFPDIYLTFFDPQNA